MNDERKYTDAQMDEAKFKVSKVLTRVITSEPFYATLLMQTKPTLSTMAPTAWVNMRGHIFFNPGFVLDHTIDELVGVAIHEVLHKVFFHVMRLQERNPKKWNVACDAIINHIIVREQHYKLPAGGVMFPEDQVVGKTADEVYSAMKDDPAGGGGWDGEGDMKDDGSQPTESDVLDIKRQVAAAVQNAKQMGKMPAGLDRLIDELLDPQKDWKELLEEALTSGLMGNDLFAYSKNSHAGRAAGTVMPALSRSVQMRKVVIGVDTSGSIDDNQLKIFISEVRGILHSIGIQETHVVYCDSGIHDVHVLPDYERDYMPAKVGGGGGTSFEPVFDYAEEQEAEAIVYFTDMYCHFPEEPDRLVVWAATTEIEGPYGSTVRIEV